MTIVPNPPPPSTLKVRRTTKSHFFHALWTTLTFYQALNSGLPARAIWGTLFVLAVAMIVKVMLKPHCMKLTGTQLTVHRDYFSSITIDITDIDRIEIEAGPFSHSKFVLKENKGHVKFDYYQVRNKEFDALVKAVGVSVV